MEKRVRFGRCGVPILQDEDESQPQETALMTPIRVVMKGKSPHGIQPQEPHLALPRGLGLSVRAERRGAERMAARAPAGCVAGANAGSTGRRRAIVVGRGCPSDDDHG
jgi:hypothetical protein